MKKRFYFVGFDVGLWPLFFLGFAGARDWVWDELGRAVIWVIRMMFWA